jgi:hypothetical protein
LDKNIKHTRSRAVEELLLLIPPAFGKGKHSCIGIERICTFTKVIKVLFFYFVENIPPQKNTISPPRKYSDEERWFQKKNSYKPPEKIESIWIWKQTWIL